MSWIPYSGRFSGRSSTTACWGLGGRGCSQRGLKRLIGCTFRALVVGNRPDLSIQAEKSCIYQCIPFSTQKAKEQGWAEIEEAKPPAPVWEDTVNSGGPPPTQLLPRPPGLATENNFQQPVPLPRPLDAARWQEHLTGQAQVTWHTPLASLLRSPLGLAPGKQSLFPFYLGCPYPNPCLKINRRVLRW